jgi:hypothetical protein
VSDWEIIGGLAVVAAVVMLGFATGAGIAWAVVL